MKFIITLVAFCAFSVHESFSQNPCDALNKEISEMGSTIEQRSFEMFKLKMIEFCGTQDSSLEESKKKVRDLEKERDELRSQIGALSSTIKQNEIKITELENANKIIGGTIISYEEQINNLNNTLESVTAENNILIKTNAVQKEFIVEFVSDPKYPELTKVYALLEGLQSNLNGMANQNIELNKKINDLKIQQRKYISDLDLLGNKYFDNIQYIQSVLKTMAKHPEIEIPKPVENFVAMPCTVFDETCIASPEFSTIDKFTNLMKVTDSNGKTIDSLAIKYLHFDNSKFWFFPSNMGSLFREVRNLTITNSELKRNLY